MGKKDDILAGMEATAPMLRRYARALGASAASADNLVQTALERTTSKIVANDVRPENLHEVRLSAYATLTELATQAMRGLPPLQPSPRHPPIVHALAGLSIEERAVLLLIVLEGLSYKDVARALELSHEATVDRLMRARASLSTFSLRPLAPGEAVKRASGHLRVVK